MNTEKFDLVDAYIDGLFGGQDPALQVTVERMTQANMPAISVSSVQGRLLHLLARLCNARKILELGTLGGFSTIWMARALPASGKLVSLELEPLHAKVARRNIEDAGLGSKVEIRVGKALDLLPVLESDGSGPFDMIFIDADKEPYAEYFQWALKLSRPGTLIIADNVIREGKVLDPSSQDPFVRGVQRFNKVLADCKDVTATIFQTVGQKEHDGIALAIVN
jgi:caffeoyl-CoA O-methyltransferase